MRRSHTSERRFGPRWLLSVRGLLTVVVAWPVLSLLVLLLRVARGPDPRFGAIVFFLVGILAMFVVPIVWWLWQPTFTWRRASREGWLLQQRIDHQARIERRSTTATEEAAAAAQADGALVGRGDEGADEATDPPAAPVAGRHRAAAVAAAPDATEGHEPGRPAPAGPRLAVRGTEGQVVTVLVEGTGGRRKGGGDPAVSRPTPAGPPVWPGHGTPSPGG